LFSDSNGLVGLVFDFADADAHGDGAGVGAGSLLLDDSADALGHQAGTFQGGYREHDQQGVGFPACGRVYRAQGFHQQQELLSRVERTHKHIRQKDEPVSAKFSEQASEIGNEELVLALDAEGRMELNQIQHAFARIESGDYLECTACGKPIGEKRLEAIPFADKCIECAD